MLTVRTFKSRPNRLRVDPSPSMGSIRTNGSSMRCQGSVGRWFVELRMNLTSTFLSLFLIKTFFCDAERRCRRVSILRTYTHLRNLVDRVICEEPLGRPRPARPGRCHCRREIRAAQMQTHSDDHRYKGFYIAKFLKKIGGPQRSRSRPFFLLFIAMPPLLPPKEDQKKHHSFNNHSKTSVPLASFLKKVCSFPFFLPKIISIRLASHHRGGTQHI